VRSDSQGTAISTVLPLTIHPACHRSQPLKTSDRQMFTALHRANDRREGEEFLLLQTQERVPIEEGENASQEICSAPNNQHKRVVIRTPVILSERTTAERDLNEPQ
jgi:hypothetical protein